MDPIILTLIIIVVTIQIGIFIRTWHSLNKYVNIFKRVAFDRDEESHTIVVHDPSLFLSDNIVAPINQYLSKNEGAVADFLLIKDIVERNCDMKREEIDSQLPMPLYLGLMGTMLGIITGIGGIALKNGNGFSEFINKPSESIGILMGGVAIAMIASFIGILFTTCGSWIAKSVTLKVEEGKNKFYTWIQTDLLPNIGGTANSIVMLQQNLMKFNRTFADNVNKLDQAFEKIGGCYRDQIALIEELQKLDMKNMATANVRVLQELNGCMPQLQQFYEYLQSVNNYISNVNALNHKLDANENRTKLIEEMSTFFKEEVSAISQRKAAISQTVGQVDDYLQKALENLMMNSETGMQKLNVALITQQDSFNSILNRLQEDFPEKMKVTLATQQELFNNALIEQREEFKHRMQETVSLLDGLKDFLSKNSDLNSFKEELIVIAHEQKEQLALLANAIENITIHVDNELPNISSNVSIKIPQYAKYLLFGFAGIGIIAFLIMIVSYVFNLLLRV